MTEWDHRGKTVPMPTRINAGYRDPVRAFKFNNKWWQGVGCGSKTVGAQFCIFEAEDDTLMNFTDRGSLYTTNVTYGNVDGNIVWQPQNVSANMMECPDLFPLGDKWVLVGSLYKTNQWWVGDLVADADGVPRFTPDAVGILDYGNGYAAKTGSTMIQSGSTRRVVFGFTGWSEPTTAPGCGRSLIMPRDLSVVGSRLVIHPVPETAVLRVASSHSSDPTAMAKGSQVEIRLVCPFTTAPSGGTAAVRVLGGTDGSYTEIGYDFTAKAFYADHSKCCTAPNTIVQRGNLDLAVLVADGGLNVTVFVDGGTIEAFANGVAITPLVSPSLAIAPADRTSALSTLPTGLKCTVDSWQQKY
jgi:beta-fructofuranosidase